MTDAANKRLNQWLRDAHAMEKQAAQMLSGQASRIESYPKVRDRIRQHLKETEEHARRVEACLKARGDDTSLLKDAGAQMMAMGQAFAGMFAGDEIMKGSLASYTFEHMEIASYKIIIAAAEELGDMKAAQACRQNLSEEIAMADWLSENVGELTLEFLDREANLYAEAKR
jgi:ferritin-like metal-binding protein YciE